MQSAQYIALPIIAAIIFCIPTLLLNSGDYPYGDVSFHINIAIGVASAVLQICAASVFISGLRYFKTQFRHAYLLLCSGIIMLGVSQIQAPLLIMLNLGESFWVRSGLVAIPYILPIILIFIGIRRLARIMDVSSPWLSFIRSGSIAILAGALLSLLPHGSITTTEIEFRSSVGIAGWTTAFFIAITIVSRKIYKSAAEIYKTSLLWLTRGLGIFAFTSAFYAVGNLIFGSNSPLQNYGFNLLPHLAAAFTFLKAGEAFVSINKPQTAVNSQSTNISALDIVMYTASQVSNPRQIEPIVADLRTITLDIREGQPLTKEQVAELKRIYYNLEQYLVKEESIRKFTHEDLRRNVAQHFQIDPSKISLWS